jgi:hypothetical protein
VISKILKGANMDIDMIPSDKVQWEQDKCPWNQAEGNNSTSVLSRINQFVSILLELNIRIK